MKEILQRVHEKVGDFWWYSLMLFCACRAADLLNAFVGIWLVPKYVSPSELGAVMPLTNFANTLAIPAAVFANTFRNEFTRLSVSREFGKLKSLMRGVFVTAAFALFGAILVARFTLPLFLERIRIVEGSLGMLIITAAFLGAVSPIYVNALQSLKKFRENAVLSIISAPLRFVTMIVTMPFRAISGYFVGQTSTPAFLIAASVFCLKKELSVPAEPYWNREVFKRFSKLLAVFTVIGVVGSIYNLVETTVIRQRLPDIDSAGYYMATRFSDIANFLYFTLLFTMFPFTAEIAAKGKDSRPLIIKATAATVAFSALIALPFFFAGRDLLAILPYGNQYSAYWWAIPWLIGIGCFSAFIGMFTTSEMSANRFGYLKWMMPIDVLYVSALLIVTGYGYLKGTIPDSWFGFLENNNIRSLDTMLWWMTAANLIKGVGCAVALSRQKPQSKKLP